MLQKNESPRRLCLLMYVRSDVAYFVSLSRARSVYKYMQIFTSRRAKKARQQISSTQKEHLPINQGIFSNHKFDKGNKKLLTFARSGAKQLPRRHILKMLGA